jgi:hypothetical protein
MYAKGEKIETKRHESKYQGKKIPGMRSWGGKIVSDQNIDQG